MGALQGLAGALCPMLARGQPAPKITRVGYLGLGTADASATRIAALRAGLNSLGYIEGKNIAIQFCLADTAEELQKCAAQLVEVNVDIIFATSSTEVGA